MDKRKEREQQFKKTIEDIKHIYVLVEYFLEAIECGEDPVHQNVIDFPFGKSVCKTLKEYTDKLVKDFEEESEKQAENEEDEEM